MNNNPKMEPMFYKYFNVNMQSHGTFRSFEYVEKPMVIWQSFHLSLKKCTVKIIVSIPALDIHKLVQELQDSRILKVYFSLVFFAILSKISLTTICLDRKIRGGLCFRISFFKYGASTKDMALTT
jgi:hypothetical protein